MLQTIKSKVTFLVISSTIVLSLLSLAGLFGLYTLRSGLTMSERYDDLLNNVLEVRRFEKNFLFYHNAESLSEMFLYLQTVDALVKQLSDDIILVAGKEPFDAFLTNFAAYKALMQGFLEELPRMPADMTEIRDRGKTLVDFIQGLIQAKRRQIHRTILSTFSLPVAFWAVFIVSLLVMVKLILNRFLRPLGLIQVTTERVAQGDFSPMAIQSAEKDEITGLINAFNRMAEELETNQEHLIQSRKMAALGTFTAGIAHELNNPINNISLTAEAFLEDYDNLMAPEAQELLKDIVGQTARAADIVKSLLDFSRTEQPSVSALNLKDVVKSTVNLLKNQLMITHVDLKLDLPDDLPAIRGNFRKLEQVFMNLIQNALQAMPEGGRLNIVARQESPDFLRLDIEDTGQGIPQEYLPHIFEPFFTTKGVGQGSGLGLAVSYSLIQLHGGRIEVKSTLGQGSVFSVYLPVADLQEESSHAAADSDR